MPECTMSARTSGPEKYHHNLPGLLVCGLRSETTIPNQRRSAIDGIATFLRFQYYGH